MTIDLNEDIISNKEKHLETSNYRKNKEKVNFKEYHNVHTKLLIYKKRDVDMQINLVSLPLHTKIFFA